MHRTVKTLPLILVSLLTLTLQSSAPLDRSLCHECFWTFQSPKLKKEVTSVYKDYNCGDDFCRGEVWFLLGTVTGDDRVVRNAIASYRAAEQREVNPRRKLLLEMILGMAGGRAGVDERAHLASAAKLASEQGRQATSELLLRMRDGSATPQFGDAPIRKKLVVPPGSRFFVLGESTIRLRRGQRVAVQIERTYRDWLSHHLSFDFRDSSLGLERVLDYHEGARLRDIIRLANVRPLPIAGTIIARRGEKWYGPDDRGVFRFEVLNDKVWYPTTKRRGDFALVTDTHGISSLVDQSVAEKADLVIGCGDNPGKMQAAYYLAQKGINVYFPCDRQVAMVLGHDAPGVLLGSAPVHVVNGETVIGNQPVRFQFGEKVVVTDIKSDSVARYYDSGARYFRALSTYIPLQIQSVYVGDKEAGKAIVEANRIGATVVGIRVRYEEDYVPVKQWLATSPKHRVVLFHSAPYPAGNRLFAEFPKQVTFGDPRPRFSAN